MQRSLLLLAAGALGACSPPPDPPRSVTIPLPPAAATPPDPSPAASASATASAPLADAASPLPLLLELERLLEQDKLTVGDVVAKVGRIEEDPGPPMPIRLRPRAPWLREAKLSRYPEGPPYVLELTFTPEARPTIQALRGIFGDDRPSGRGLHGERETIFYPPSKSKRWSVAVLASLSRCWDPHSSADPPPEPCEPIQAGSRVETLAFRRDPAS